MGRSQRAGGPTILAIGLMAVAALLAACNSGAGAPGSQLEVPGSKPTATPFIRSIITGNATPEPLPDVVGGCAIRPQTQCPGADLRGAQLGAVKVAGHPFRSAADLKGANLRGADLTAANLAEVVLDSADLRDAILRGAIVVSGSMLEADLRGADLTGANFLFADMEGVRLDGAILCNTTMSDGTTNNDGCP